MHFSSYQVHNIWSLFTLFQNRRPKYDYSTQVCNANSAGLVVLSAGSTTALTMGYHDPDPLESLDLTLCQARDDECNMEMFCTF